MELLPAPCHGQAPIDHQVDLARPGLNGGPDVVDTPADRREPGREASRRCGDRHGGPAQRSCCHWRERGQDTDRGGMQVFPPGEGAPRRIAQAPYVRFRLPARERREVQAAHGREQSALAQRPVLRPCRHLRHRVGDGGLVHAQGVERPLVE